MYKHFGPEIALKVDQHFEDVIDNIAVNPLLYPLSEKKTNLRRCVIIPQGSSTRIEGARLTDEEVEKLLPSVKVTRFGFYDEL